MRRLVDILRLITISFEALFLLLLVAGLVWMPEPYTHIGELLAANREALRFLITIPVSLLAVSFGLFWKILFPRDDNKVLLEWEGYLNVHDRVMWSLFLCLVCAGIAVGVYLFATDISTRWLTLLGFFAWVTPVIVTTSLLLAASQIRYLLERHGEVRKK